jgi:hypothetical protein
MKKVFIVLTLVAVTKFTTAQVRGTDSLTNAPLNSAQNIIAGNSGKTITIGGYAQMDYNQPFNDSTRSNGTLDVHRVVMFMGYKFNERVHFVTELEFEHVSELYVEQAFVNYRINSAFNIRGGLMLIPMGIVNEYHEPTIFNGVERPNIDGKIVPTTWREMGAGFTGNLDKLSLKYQVFVVNGFKSYDGKDGKLKGSDGFRGGRQKGLESTISSPNLASKIDFYGIRGLKLGASGYFGETQTTAYNGVLNSDADALKIADSTVVGLSMFGFDFRYNYKAFEARGQVIYAGITNTQEYNAFTKKDLGSSMFGWYGELGYDVLSLFKKEAKERFVVFGRYEFYDTHNSVEKGTIRKDAYGRTDVTMGFSYHIAQGATFKADYQLFKIRGSETTGNQINVGLGVWF